MKTSFALALALALQLAANAAPLPDNLVAEGIPEIPAGLDRDARRYLEFRSGAFNDWHPERNEMLLTTRFADSSQLHLVKTPGGARRQLTFLEEPVEAGLFDPRDGEFVVFLQDTGGAEFYQLHRLDFADGRVTLLTDGKSRNLSPAWSRRGDRLAYTSTRRNGRDTDVYVMDPRDPGTDRMLAQLQGGGWSIQDWSPDDSRLLLREYLSINESRLHVCDAKTGKLDPVTPPADEKVSWHAGAFAADGKSLIVRTDKDSEFLRLCRVDLRTGKLTPLSDVRGDVESFDLARDGRKLAFVSNEDGISRLRVIDARTGRKLAEPRLPAGVIGSLKWRPDSRVLGFNLSSARSPTDAWSLDIKTGRVDRWTESETGGLNSERFVEPELLKLKSFDGLEISAFVYRPDPKKFSGKRPVLVQIHGGPESQSRPGFQARNNNLLNELGIAIVLPNVRGSTGRGKTFLTLDNGRLRENAVRDIGTILDWIARDSRLDRERIAVAGGSYGGYMSLATMIHFGDRLRCGIDVVGISNFVTFLRNTQDYRRDLRRAEYGDEQDAAMREFLESISPANHAGKIRKPLLVVQGKNDPRVPASESEQMVKAIRDHGGTVWYLLATDEGHGFAKKKNQDYQFLATLLFLKQHLLD